MTARCCTACQAPLPFTGAAAKGRRLCDPCQQARTALFDCPGCGRRSRVSTARRDEQGRPVECCDCLQAAEDEVRTEAIVDRLAQLEPALARAAIMTALREAAPSRLERRRLAEHLDAHPDALVSGASSATRVVCRLARSLAAEGAVTVRPPLCGRCGQPRLLVVDVAGEGRICGTCDRHRRAEPCAFCGRIRAVSTRTPEGQAICGPCHLRDPSHWETCAGCGRHGRVNARTPDGRAICTGCYESPPGRCARCGTLGPIAARRTEGALCPRCYVKEGPRRACGRCGRIKRINRRAQDGEPDLCNACHWAPIGVCVRCGEERPGRGKQADAHVCLHCMANERLDEVLRGPGGIPPALEGLRAAFFAAEQPRSILTWLHRSPGAALLRRLASGELELSHTALDQLEQTPALRHLRQMLVATGALPESDPHVAALERFVAAAADALTDADDARLLRSYGTWQVLARLRRRRGGPTPSTVKNAHSTFGYAAGFLRWLHDQGLTLAACGQHHLDRWLAEGPPARRRVRYLLLWAIERGITNVEPPTDAARTAPLADGGESRWADARRLLHDDALDPADRVVGGLVVLYAQPLTRIAALRLEDRHEIDHAMHLSFGKDLVFMPDPLGTFLRELPWRRQVGPSGHVAGADQWLFPGRQAGRHQHPEYLASRLRAIGISPRAVRSQALVQLGAAVPAKVLADLLNLHPNTAVRWIKVAGGDWTAYAAGRARARSSP